MNTVSPKMRIGAGIVTALAAGAIACTATRSDTGNPAGPSGPPAAGTPIVYSVVGASDVIGYGSSKVCFLYEDCDGNGYAWVAARQLRSQSFTVSVGPLGIPGAVVSRAFQDLAAQYGRTDIVANITQSEMPFVKPEATLVTIFAGANDVNVITGALGRGAGGSDPTGFVDQRITAFNADYAALVAGIRARARSARIIVFNLPNMAGLPFLASASLSQKQAAQRASVQISTTGINALRDVTVIDLLCDARFYQASTYSSDGFHPSDNGYALMGGEIVRALTSSSYAPPRGSCSQMTLF